METKFSVKSYQTPQVEMIEVEVECGFSNSSSDGTGTGENMGWG